MSCIDKGYYEVERYREDYPILARNVYGKPLVYLDNAATTQAPRCVVAAIEEMYFRHKANVHRGVHALSQEATDMVERTRERVREFIGASSTDEIIFTRGTTEAINLVAYSFGSSMRAGDEVVLTVMEHHSNIVPWQLLRERLGIKIRVVPIVADGSLDLDAFRTLLNDRTKMVAVTHVSNVLGTVNPVKEIVNEAHSCGAAVLIDGAQAIAHIPVDVSDIGADFYVFSSHKMYGPTGVGVLYGRRNLLDNMPPYQGGGEMISSVTFEHTAFAELPFKFEAGTPDYVGISALHAAMDYLTGIGIERASVHEKELMNYTVEQMMDIPGMRIFGTTDNKEAIVSFLIGGHHHYDTGMLLDKLGVAVRTGHHCAQPLMNALGVDGTVRVSFALYNTKQECDAFISALQRTASILG